MSNFENPAEQAFVSSFTPDPGTQNQPIPPDSGQPQAQPQAPVTPQTPSVEQRDQSLIAAADIDLSGLSDEQQLYLRSREREMQAHMTRRLQEAADARKEAERSVQFLEALNSDPTFALGVFSQLQQNLNSAGYLDGGNPNPDGGYWDEQGQYQEPQGPDPYAMQIASIQAQNEAIQQQLTEQRLAQELDNQLSALRGQHPDWADSDWQAVVDLGFATGGNLMAAAERHGAYRDSVLQAYLDRKQSVQAPAPLPQGSGATPVQQPLRSDEQLRAAAMERIRAELT